MSGCWQNIKLQESSDESPEAEAAEIYGALPGGGKLGQRFANRGRMLEAMARAR